MSPLRYILQPYIGHTYTAPREIYMSISPSEEAVIFNTTSFRGDTGNIWPIPRPIHLLDMGVDCWWEKQFDGRILHFTHICPRGPFCMPPPQGGDDRIISRNERTTELISSFDDNRQTMYIDGGNPAATHTIKTHTLTRTETQTKSHTHTRSHTQSHNLHKHIIPTHIYTRMSKILYGRLNLHIIHRNNCIDIPSDAAKVLVDAVCLGPTCMYTFARIKPSINCVLIEFDFMSVAI